LSLEEEAADDAAPVPANSLANSSLDMGEAPTIRRFGSPSPVPSNHGQTPGIMNTSRQGLSADHDFGRLENGDNTSQEVSGKPVLLCGPDIAESLPGTGSIPPRRSKRLQLPEPSITEGSTGITSVDSLKRIARLRPKRKAAGNPISMVSAKPRGISKR
jgi:hypothetical protein